MISNLFKDTVTTKRKAKGTQNALGETSKVESIIYSGILVRLEQRRKKMDYKNDGVRRLDEIWMYVKPTNSDILERDIVYVDDAIYGIIDSVVPAYGPGGNAIDHYECSIELP